MAGGPKQNKRMTSGMADYSVSKMGEAALLLDVAAKTFSDEAQCRVHAVAKALESRAGILEIVPGVNNLLIEIDPDVLDMADACAILTELCCSTPPIAATGRLIEIPVIYGGRRAEDIERWADYVNLSVEAAVERHAAGSYRVACIGAMAGFGYLSGLDPALAMPRRDVPRMRVETGSVIIGGAQAAVMPTTAPSGWHIIGHTETRLFDPSSVRPTLFSPNDEVRFKLVDLIR